MKIGQTVNYIRQIEANTVEGTGILRGLGLDANNREIALVRDKEKVFNVPTSSLNPTPAYIERFKKYAVTVTELSAECNKKQLELVKAYNDRLDTLHDSMLGAPIVGSKPESLITSNTEGEQQAAESLDDESHPKVVSSPRTAKPGAVISKADQLRKLREENLGRKQVTPRPKAAKKTKAKRKA